MRKFWPSCNLIHRLFGRQRAATRTTLAMLLLTVLLCPGHLGAQQSSSGDLSDKETIRALLQRVEQLEARVAQLENKQPAAASTTAAAQAPPQAAAPTPAPAAAPPAAETAPQPEIAETEIQRMEMKTRMQIRGFGDVTLHGSDLRGDHTAFSLGQLNLFVTSDVSEKFRFLSEIVFEADTRNSVGVDVERLLLQYSKNDYFNLAVGRYHTAIGFYNTAYHHAAWLQTATGRPLVFQFEDNGGILPIHNVGASLSGLIPSGKLGLHYIAEVGNGRASSSPDAEAVQNRVDENNGKAVNFAVFARPEKIRGFQTGFSAYHDGLQPVGQPHIDELIFDAHAVVQRPSFEWLNEALLIRHAVNGGHIFETPAFYTQISKAFGAYRPYFRYQYINESPNEPMFPFVGLNYGPSVGVRYDPSESVALKLQYDRTAFRQQPSTNGLTLQFAFTF
jgi:outer membrane murein-binding lipoprotein Lpp